MTREEYQREQRMKKNHPDHDDSQQYQSNQTYGTPPNREQYFRNQNNNSGPYRDTRENYQSQYNQGYAPQGQGYIPRDAYNQSFIPTKKKHHFFKWLLITLLVIILAVLGLGAYGQYQSKQVAQNNKPSTTINRQNNSHNNIKNYKGSGSTKDDGQIKSALNKLQLSQATQKEALNKFNNISQNGQRTIMDKLNQYKGALNNPIERPIARHYVQNMLNNQ